MRSEKLSHTICDSFFNAKRKMLKHSSGILHLVLKTGILSKEVLICL